MMLLKSFLQTRESVIFSFACVCVRAVMVLFMTRKRGHWVKQFKNHYFKVFECYYHPASHHTEKLDHQPQSLSLENFASSSFLNLRQLDTVFKTESA